MSVFISHPFDPMARAFIPPHMVNAASPSRNAGTYTWGAQFYVSYAAIAYGARVYYVQTSGAESVKVLLWRQSDGVLLASGTRSLSVTGQYDIQFDAAATLSPATRYRVGWYISGTYITIPSSYSPIQASTSNYDSGAGVYYENANLFVASAETMPTTNGAARTPIAVLVR